MEKFVRPEDAALFIIPYILSYLKETTYKNEMLSFTTAKAPENITIRTRNQSYKECVERNMNPREENEKKRSGSVKAISLSLDSAARLWLISPTALRELFRADIL